MSNGLNVQDGKKKYLLFTRSLQSFKTEWKFRSVAS